MADKSSYMWNVERHFSEMFSLPIDFLHESLIWDAGHRFELVYDDVKNGKNNQYGNVVAVATPWIQELDTCRGG